MRKIITFIFTVVLLNSCESSKQFAGNNINVDVKDDASVSDFIDGYHYVILETNDKSAIDKDSKFHTSNDYIVSFSNSVGFIVFDINGTHLTSFDHHGEGPAEYNYISDFYINDNSIFAVSPTQKKLIEYNIRSGNFIAEYKLPNSYLYAAQLDYDNVVLCSSFSNTSNQNFAIYSLSSKKVAKEYAPFKNVKTYVYSDFNAIIGKENNAVYAVLPYSHNLYKITVDKCEIIENYEFNTADQLPSISDADIDLAKMDQEYRRKRTVNWLGFFNQTSTNICYQNFSLLTEYGILPFLCKFNALTGETKTLKIGAKRFVKYPYLSLPPFEFANGSYVSAVRADIALRIDKQINTETFKNLGVTENSNPIIFFHHLKS